MNRFLDILKKLDSSDKNRNSRVLIIDGLNLYMRVFSVVPEQNEDGDFVGGLVGFIQSLIKEIRNYSPTRCIIVFDGVGGSVRRKKVYPDYKANRNVTKGIRRKEFFNTIEEEEYSMKVQFKRIIEYLDKMPIDILSFDGVEADDVIAYITYEVLKDSEIRIVSTDRDFLQLVDNRVQVYSPVKQIVYDRDTLEKEVGIQAENYLIYRSLTGDISDNIDGVNGIGLATLIKRIPDIVTKPLGIDDILVYCGESQKNSKIKLYESIISNEEKIRRNLYLMTLKDVDISEKTKLKIHEKVSESKVSSDRVSLKQMYINDKLYNTKLNIEGLLQILDTLMVWTH